jgi:polyhydroxyalkanoate synthesis regulator phasin
MKIQTSILLMVILSLTAWAPAKDGEKADRREARQQRRIEQGIVHGQLTPDEVKQLEAQESKITAMQKNFMSDGKLTKDEGKQLEGALNDASLQIWAHRHDTDGNQMPALRLGTDVFANDDIIKQVESGDMTHAQAHDFLDDFRKMVHMKNRLSTDDLTDAQRTNVQNRYNDLLNKYFYLK